MAAGVPVVEQQMQQLLQVAEYTGRQLLEQQQQAAPRVLGVGIGVFLLGLFL
jgi:hypothetical protein